MDKVVFKCKRSGNCVSFAREEDIAAMRKHEGYEEITPVPVTTQQPETQKRGRPRKEELA